SLVELALRELEVAEPEEARADPVLPVDPLGVLQGLEEATLRVLELLQPCIEGAELGERAHFFLLVLELARRLEGVERPRARLRDALELSELARVTAEEGELLAEELRATRLVDRSE